MKALIELIVLAGILLLFTVGSYFLGFLLTLGNSEVTVLDKIALGLMMIGMLASTRCVWKLTNLVANRFVDDSQRHRPR